MRFRLRTLLILLGLVPPLLAGGWFVWEQQIVMPRQRRLERLNAGRAALKARIAELQAQRAELQASQNARVLQRQRLNAARAELNAQIAELQASQDARELKLQQLQEELKEEYGENTEMYRELVRQLSLVERLRYGFPGHAGPGIMFLGPELARPRDTY